MHTQRNYLFRDLSEVVNNINTALSWTECFPIPFFSSPPVRKLFRAIHGQGYQLKKLSPLCSASLSAALEPHSLKCFASSEAYQTAQDSNILSLHMAFCTSAGYHMAQTCKASSTEITRTISCAPEEFASWAPTNASPTGTLKQSYRRLQRRFHKTSLV